MAFGVKVEMLRNFIGGFVVQSFDLRFFSGL